MNLKQEIYYTTSYLKVYEARSLVCIQYNTDTHSNLTTKFL